MLFQFTYRVSPVFFLAHALMGMATARYLVIKERNLQFKTEKLQRTES